MGDGSRLDYAGGHCRAVCQCPKRVGVRVPADLLPTSSPEAGKATLVVPCQAQAGAASDGQGHRVCLGAHTPGTNHRSLPDEIRNREEEGAPLTMTEAQAFVTIWAMASRKKGGNPMARRVRSINPWSIESKALEKSNRRVA